jgi:cell division protein FtsB
VRKRIILAVQRFISFGNIAPMRVLALLFAALVIGLQWPLWLGRGGVPAVNAMQKELSEQRSRVETLQKRNAALDGETKDLKSGLQAVEEHARSELGMVKSGEVFFQLISEPSTASLISPIRNTSPAPAPTGTGPKP